MTLLYQPQYPVNMRYQWWHYPCLERELNRRFANFVTLGNDFLEIELKSEVVEYDKANFSPIEKAVELEEAQIKDYMKIVSDDDILYCSDLSFPGFFPNVLYHKRPRKAFAYCHATSINKYDYFEKVRHTKWLVEMAHSKMFDKIFVGSKYHADKLGWDNIEVVGLPKPPFVTCESIKEYNIISVARPSRQKVSWEIEDKIKELYPIIRKDCSTWGEYYKFLSQAKILLISAKEDTFNYSIVEAVMNNTVVLAPNRCSYPELLPREYIYNNIDELKEKIEYYLTKYDEVPKLLNIDLIENFYDNIADIMGK